MHKLAEGILLSPITLIFFNTTFTPPSFSKATSRVPLCFYKGELTTLLQKEEKVKLPGQTPKTITSVLHSKTL